MSEILYRIENILDSATTLGGTKDIDCEQVLKDASYAIFTFEARVSELEKGLTILINSNNNYDLSLSDDDSKYIANLLTITPPKG